MKKFISMVLSFLMLISVFSASPVALSVSEKNEENNLQSFVNETIALTNIKTVSENNFGVSLYSNESETEDFNSSRLILKSEKTPEKLNSIGMADGFLDYYIIQFETRSDAETAFEYYSKQKYVLNIGYDDPCEISLDDSTSDLEIITAETVPSRLNSWGSEATGLYALKDYINAENIECEEIVVGILDYKVDYSHEFLQGRTVETNFDGSADGFKIKSHGTMVSSVIVDSTPNNVKIASYPLTLTSEAPNAFSMIAAAFLQAAIDGVDIINASFRVNSSNDVQRELMTDAVRTAYEKGIIIVASAGNENSWLTSLHNSILTSLPFVIVASACTETFMPTSFSNHGYGVDVCAPGQNIITADADNSYCQDAAGTSFSAPIVVSACVIALSLNQNITPDEMQDKVKESVTPFDEHFTFTEMYGTGIIDAIELSGLNRIDEVTANYESGKYTEEIYIEFTSNNSEEIYYTIDNTIPSKTNGMLFSEPIKISGEIMLLKAVAYGEDGLPSKIMSKLYRSAIIGDDKDFTIDDTGKILSYSGTLEDLIIPDYINGIMVTDIEMGAFDNCNNLAGITFPSTMDTVPEGCFHKHQTIKFADGESIKVIGLAAFYQTNLIMVNFPNVEKIEASAFEDIRTMRKVSFPKVKFIDEYAFAHSTIFVFDLPELEILGPQVFEYDLVYRINMPKLIKTLDEDPYFNAHGIFNNGIVLSTLDLQSAEYFPAINFKNAKFSDCRIEFSKITELGYLPNQESSDSIRTPLVLPSTLNKIDVVKTDIVSAEYVIYGSKDTYVEQWAIENDVEFIEITSQTAVITDLPEYYKPYMGELRADVVGFNRTYQWYANTENNNTTGKPIEGATGKTFNPADYDYAPYYYCVVTSQDIGYEPITIRTSATENRSAHTHSYESVLTAPTCTGDGYTTYTCSACCDTYIDDYVNAIGHTDGEWEITIEPTYEKDGEKTLYCAVCGDVIKTEPIEKLPSKVTEVTLNKTVAEISYKDTFALLPEIMMNGNIDYTVTYSSSNEEVATVDENGNVVGVMRGNATITCTVTDSNGNTFTNTCEVTVNFTIWQWILYILFFGWIWM